MHSALPVRAIVGATVLLAAMACGSVGPGTIRSAKFDYNRAITGSWDQQLLLNLVRLRYRDTPQFLQVGSVLAGYTLRGGSAAGVAINAEGTSRTVSTIGGEVVYEERPTITYVPLQGEQFTRHLLTPIALEPLFLLAGSGWSIERLLRCCVQQINGIRNAPTTAGPTPRFGDAATRFGELAFMLRSMQLDGTLSGVIDVADIGSPRPPVPRFVLRQTADVATNQRIAELRQMLGLVDQCGEFPVRSGLGEGGSCSIVMQTRSLLGVMFFLSLGVDVPQRDVAAGLVTATVDERGDRFDWRVLIGDLMHIRSADSEPERAFVKIRYRGSWWYIDDADLESKSTFFLLTWLFNLQAAAPPGSGPLLTVGAGA